MKKELLINTKRFDLYFFYDDRSLSVRESNVTKSWLAYTVTALESFLFTKDLKEISKSNSIKKYVLNVSLCGEQKIRSLNKNFRAKDKVTDVLSFPLQENLRFGEVDNFIPEIELGDIYVCKQVCTRQAKTFAITYYEELVHLIVHGFLHLCGYDHEIDEEEEKIMFELEEKILKEVSKIKNKIKK